MGRMEVLEFSEQAEFIRTAFAHLNVHMGSLKVLNGMNHVSKVYADNNRGAREWTVQGMAP